MKRVLVTGAAGFIGSHLCEALLQNQETKVIGIDNLRSGRWDRLNGDFVKIEKDIIEIDITQWLDILSQVDVVFHLAAEKYNSSKSTPEKLLDSNVLATERLARAAAISNVQRLVFTSSLYAYGTYGPQIMSEKDIPSPSTLYGASKLMGEGILRSIDRDKSLSWNVARLFFIYGPKQFAEGGYKSVIVSNFERVLDNEPPLIFGDGEQSLDYVYVDDCINALIALGGTTIDKQIVNVSSGKPVSINELTELMKVASGAKVKPVYGQKDLTHGTHRFGDNQLIKKQFNWQPSVDLTEGLKRTFEWMKNV
jgi:UDP-glucose 4-epimerase